MEPSYYKQDSREMRSLYSVTLGLVLLTVRAEKDSQGYHTEQTKGTTVTKDRLSKKENTIGHGTEAPPTQNKYRHTAAAVAAKIPEVASSATRPTPRLERIQMTEAVTVTASTREQRQKLLPSQRGSPTATRVYTKSEMPLISNNEKIVLPTTQAAFESMMNDTSEPGVNLSTDAVKSSLWLHTPHVNRSQGRSDSTPLASADRGLPALSASHPHVIDNLAAPPHDNADKQAQGKDEKEISTPRRNKSPPATVQSIIHKPALSPTVSSSSPSEGLAADFQEFTASYQALRAKSDRKQEEILNVTKIKSSLSDTGTVAFDTLSSETSLLTQNNTSVTVGPVSTNPEPHRSETKREKNRERETFGKKVSTVPPHLKLHPSLTTNFKNTFFLHRPLDVSGGSASNAPVIAEASLGTQKSVFHQGSDHSAASHPTARMRLIEAHRTVVAFSFGKPTTSAVKDPESHSLTGGAASLISALRSQTPAKPSSQTKELTLTFLPKDAAMEFTSTATKARGSPTFTTLNSIVQQPSVYPSGPAIKTPMEEPQFPTFTSPETDAPVTLLSGSRQESGDVASMLTLTPVLSKSSSGRLTMHRFSETQSKITQEKALDVTTPPFFARHSTDLSRESQIVHDLKLGDKSEQVWSLAAEDQDVMEHGEEIADSNERQKSQDDEDNESRNRTEGLFNLDKSERGSEDRKRQNMEEHESTASRENSGGIIEEDAEREDTTMMNTGNLTKDHAAAAAAAAAANPGECLTKEGAETRREETATEKDLLHNRKIGREDVTNVPPGATTDSEELNRDKGHTVINSSPCHSLIKRLEATEQKGIYLAGNTARNVEMKNKAFSYKVTSNHGQLRSSLRSRPTSLPTEPYTRTKARPSPHGAVITKPGDASSLTASAQNKVSEATFPVAAIHKTLPKHTSGAGALKLSDAWEPAVSPRGSSTGSAHPALNSFSNMTSLTAGFPKAQPHFTVNSSALSLSIIYSISNHTRRFRSSVSGSDSLIQNGLEHIYDSRVKDPFASNLTYGVNVSMSVNRAVPQQMYRPLPAEALSSEAHTSTGRPQPQEGQSAGQTSPSSPSPSFDMTSGHKCSFQLSAHSHAPRPPVDDNRQRSAQALMATMSPKAKHDQLSPSSVSVLLNPMRLGADGSPGTYSLTAITRSGSEEDEYANNGSGHAEFLSSPTEDASDSEQETVSSAVKRPDVATRQMKQSADGTIGSGFMAQAVVGSRREADSADDFSSVSMSPTEKPAAENANDNDHDNPLNIDRTDAANKEVKSTLNNNHLSQLEGYNETSTQPVVFAGQTTHKPEQAGEPRLPVPSDFASFVPDPNDGAESAAFPEPEGLVPEVPQMNANYVMTHAYFDVGSVAAEISGRQTSPPGSVGDSAVAVPQSHPRSDLKVSNTSTQQPGDQVSASELQIITTTNNDFVSPAAGINGPTSRESHELELTTSERLTRKSFLVGRAERRVQVNRPPGHRTSAQAAGRGPRAPPAPATTHPVTVRPFSGGPQDSKHAEPGKGTPPPANANHAGLSPVTSAPDFATVDKFTGENATRTTDKPSAKTLSAFVDAGHWTRGTAEKTRQRRSHTEAQGSNATKAVSSQLDWTPFAGTDAGTQTKAGADEGDSAQSAVRSVNAAPAPESGRRLLVLEPELPARKHRRRTPPHLYLSGVAEVSEDLCGSGNYTAEMSLNLGRDVEPGDAVPVLGNLRVVINLKTNNSLMNLEVTSCCLSPTVQPDLANSTCCLFSRLAAEPVGITLLPSALSTSASFTISLFQMINYSAVYLHCDLSVCLRNRSDCERECPERRSAFPAEGPDAIVTNLRNRISFGPMLKEARNATFLEEIEPSELDLALVIVSLVVGSSLVTVTLLLVWLAYRRRAIWPLRSAAPPRACCACLRPPGDSILP